MVVASSLNIKFSWICEVWVRTSASNTPSTECWRHWCWWMGETGAVWCLLTQREAFLRGWCHPRLSHSWPLGNKSARRQTACRWQLHRCQWTSPVSCAAPLAGVNHACSLTQLSPQWCKKIPLCTLERWSLTCRHPPPTTAPDSFFPHGFSYNCRDGSTLGSPQQKVCSNITLILTWWIAFLIPWLKSWLKREKINQKTACPKSAHSVPIQSDVFSPSLLQHQKHLSLS